MSDLHLDWCSYDAAKYAVHNWHYSERMPSGKLLRIGVWEDDDFTGVIIYSRGAAPNIGSPYDMEQTEICELTRVALTDHNGGIYQADNWIYERQLDGRDYIRINGETHHPRSLNAVYGTSSVKKLKRMFSPEAVERVPVDGKHKYLYPLDDETRRKVEQRAQPYP